MLFFFSNLKENERFFFSNLRISVIFSYLKSEELNLPTIFMSNMICGPWEASAVALVVYERREMGRQERAAHKIDTEK